MSKQDLIRKLTSRKFIVTAISVITGIVTIFIGENEVVEVIAGAAMTVVPAVVYCIMEGTVDAKSVKEVSQSMQDAAQALGASEAVVDTIERIGEAGEAIIGTERDTGEQEGTE